MKLSEQLQQINDSGDVGYSINGLADKAKMLEDALIKAQQDINWMLNSKQFLNGWVFDYIDDALQSASYEQVANRAKRLEDSEK